ncbi:MAG: hypothetical protein FRX49_00904 [Trebouxia sp. A1-2]|nr:MAG: hypothetical protein FRX49_00904 [Trebouxia sp. A1-2]
MKAEADLGPQLLQTGTGEGNRGHKQWHVTVLSAEPAAFIEEAGDVIGRAQTDNPCCMQSAWWPHRLEAGKVIRQVEVTLVALLGGRSQRHGEGFVLKLGTTARAFAKELYNGTASAHLLMTAWRQGRPAMPAAPKNTMFCFCCQVGAQKRREGRQAAGQLPFAALGVLLLQPC